MIVVLDASVVLKWYFRDRPDEKGIDQSLAILSAVDSREIEMVQPPHFLAEVTAVLVREKPNGAQVDLNDLQNIDWRSITDPNIYSRAMALSIKLHQHVFDTLYHATALEFEQATLVTSDQRYYSKAKDTGNITLLSDYVSVL